MNPLLRALPTDRLPHGWQLLATLLAVASAFTFCWYISQHGWVDIAASGVAFYAVTFLRMLGPNLAKRAPREFRRTASILDTARGEFAEWMGNRKLLSLAIIALVSTVVFLIGRFVASTLMIAISSPWLALAVGLALAAAVASPVLVKSLVESFKGSSRSGDDHNA